MDSGLVKAMGQLQVANTGDINDILFERRASKRRKRDARDARDSKQHLEAQFLTPHSHFSAEWLNKLQQRWESPPDCSELFVMAPTQSRTVTRFVRHGLEGKVTGYTNVTVPANSATAKNSTSMLRKPAGRVDFVRGAAGFFPFAPGGLDGVEATAAVEDQVLRATADPAAARTPGSTLDRIITLSSEDHLLQTAPGMWRGIDFSKRSPPSAAAANPADARDVEEMLGQEPEAIPERLIQNNATELTTGGQRIPSTGEQDGSDDNEEDGQGEAEDEAEGDIDAILPVEFPSLEPHGMLAPSSSKKHGREWAHMVNVRKDMSDFRELVPDMAREWPFELDTFQKEAVYQLENGDSVFVAAHTSAGKTVVAEYAIALASKHMTKAIYTSPIKALSNQKYRDFKETFSDVGILTGDVQINPEASCLIMTTEILRSMLYRGADVIRDVEFVIFDEVHYVNDFERGVVWEEVIIMLPDHVSLILLSATVPNTYEFASWVGRTKKKDIYVISTTRRPVPLEHYLWAKGNMHKIVDANNKFLETGWKTANSAMKGVDKPKEAAPPGNVRGGTRGNQRRGGGQRGSGQRGGGRGGGGGGQRGGGAGRGGHAANHMGRAGGFAGRTSAAQDRTLWVNVVKHLKKDTLLPACIFVFSKKRCEANADSLSNQDFCTANEKSLIHMVIEKSVARLRPEDRKLPQIIRIRELLGRGIAVHHGGLLPIVKELVEILFARTLVKVLFATETFAMGLNLPTRTVVFSGYRKHDGHEFRNLLPGEYTQMAGRAGRRGLDTVGSVIIVPVGSDEAPPAVDLQKMMLGEPSKLRSQFRLTYNMILNLLRVEALKIEEMIKRSFSEHATQQLLPQHEKGVSMASAELANVKRETCEVCDEHMDACHQAAMDYKKLTSDLYQGMLTIPVGRKMFCQGRLILFQKEGVRTPGILLADGASAKSTPSGPMLHVCEIKTHKDTRNSTDMLPPIGRIRQHFTPLLQARKHIQFKNQHVPLSDVECLTKYVTKGIVPEVFTGGDSYHEAITKMNNICQTWQANHWDEMDLSKIKSLQLIELINKRTKAAEDVLNSPSATCPYFVKHFAMCNDQWVIKETIVQLKQQLSDQNLQLLPDYEQRIEVLKKLSFVDYSSRIQLKGKVACEIHSGDELILTELILENVLRDYEPAEIAALLSSFVFQEKTEVAPTLTDKLSRGRDKIVDISKRVYAVQTTHQVIDTSEANDFELGRPFGLVEVVYEWARGMSFKNITDLTDVMEGTIVRTITRLDETCREVKNAARIIGDPDLYQKMQTTQELIKRDITAVASLYM
ncbi:putative ATP-dependent RNA helicase [Zalerion maritima]|uniref:ATP-dependent RNA helicase n=1 Tax=Zalerion maritima TaxID=339359 RepID=A0AAD5RKQ3_9PEZI|nr:putative ATP-dependent RNA helicase [Zalerion maritima]